MGMRKGKNRKIKNSVDEGHLIIQVKIQHINYNDWDQMSYDLKVLQDDTNLQEEVSPRKLRWDSLAIGAEESQDNDSEDENDLYEQSDEEEESDFDDMENDGDIVEDKK